MSLSSMNPLGMNFLQTNQVSHLAQLSNISNLSFDQDKSRNFSVIDSSKQGCRLYEKSDGSVELIQKTPAEVLGEKVLRPMIDKSVSFGKSAFDFIGRSFCYLDGKLSKIFQILPGAKATDVGQIAYFEGNCPNGWSDYIEGQSKFIFGAGGGYNIGSTGGEFEHTLTEDEMPEHDHGYTDPKISPSDRAGVGSLLGGDRYREYPTVNAGTTTSSGGGQPHNNMPPYIVLRACKKTSEQSSSESCNCDLTSYATISDVSTLQTRINNLDISDLEQEIINLEGRINSLNEELSSVETTSESEDSDDWKIVAISALVSSLVLPIFSSIAVCWFLTRKNKKESQIVNILNQQNIQQRTQQIMLENPQNSP